MGKNKKLKRSKEITISGMNPDEWLDAKSESIEKPDIPPPMYQKRIVAFLDLLAMKDIILKTKPGNEREALEKIEKIKGIVEIETKPFKRNNDFSLLHISDSFIFTCSKTEVFVLLQLLAVIQMRILIECKFQLRGAITYGDVYVADEGKQIIGPAYILAYLLQERNAIYPRIILDNSLLQLTNKHDNHTDINMIKLSNDRENYIDYMDIFIDNKEKGEIINKLKNENVFDFLAQNYLRFNKESKHSEKQKYGWTIQYFKNKGVWPDDRQYNNW